MDMMLLNMIKINKCATQLLMATFIQMQKIGHGVLLIIFLYIQTQHPTSLHILIVWEGGVGCKYAEQIH